MRDPTNDQTAKQQKMKGWITSSTTIEVHKVANPQEEEVTSFKTPHSFIQFKKYSSSNLRVSSSVGVSLQDGKGLWIRREYVEVVWKKMEEYL